MIPFVLPSLKPPPTGRTWNSRIRLPPQNPSFLDTVPKLVFPTVEASRCAEDVKKLEALRAEQRLSETIESIERQQRKLRATIGRCEYEWRYHLLWQHQEEKAMLECCLEAASVSASARQRARYSQKVRDFEARGHVQHVEAVMRENIQVAEKDARDYIISLENVVSFKGLQRTATGEAESVESFLDSLKGVQEIERRIAQDSFRPPSIFEPVTQLTISRGCALNGSFRTPTLFYDSAPCKEEHVERVTTMIGEQLDRLIIYWEHDVVTSVSMRESALREKLYQLFRWGSCQLRLRALLTIQRWWRMLQAAPWTERCKKALRLCLRERRWRMTSADYHNVLSRMRKNQSPHGNLVSKNEVSVLMAALLRAAEISHQWTYEYFVYTLMNYARQMYELAQHDLGVGSSSRGNSSDLEGNNGELTMWSQTPMLMPNRMFLRLRTMQLYPQWRATRWVDGSVTLIQLQEGLGIEESHGRRDVEMRKAYEMDTLRLFWRVLQEGEWPWRSLCTNLLFIAHEETIARELVSESERNTRATLTVAEALGASLFHSLETERLYATQEEAQRRKSIEEEQIAAIDKVKESEWRWENLFRYRRRLAMTCTNLQEWKHAYKRGLGVKYDSLDSVARVITRFFRRILLRRKLAAIRSKDYMREKHARQSGLAMASLLSRLLEDERASVARHIVQYGATAVAAAGAGSCLHDSSAVAPDDNSHNVSSAENGSYANMSAAAFSKWFDEKAKEPMERNYKEIVARFIADNKALYKGMHYLFGIVRSVREGIEEKEKSARIALCRSPVFLKIYVHELGIAEENARMTLIKEVESGYLKICEYMQLLGALRWCTTPAEMPKAPEPSSSEKRKKKSEMIRALLPLPAYMTDAKRLLCREEVRRTRIAVEEVRAYRMCLQAMHAHVCGVISAEEKSERLSLCMAVDGCCPRTPPVAQIAALAIAEEMTRRPIEEGSSDFHSVALRCASEYAFTTLWKKFMRGFQKFYLEAQYFDRHMTILLLHRVTLLGSKPLELQAMETCARARLEFFEELERSMMKEKYCDS